MPNRDREAHATLRQGRMATSGNERVVYRNARGQTREALVLSEGTNSGLKLQIIEGSRTRRIVDDVEMATSEKQTGVYFSRL
jgi:hypothetical protein